MPDYFVGQKKITLRPSDARGKGGEADIYVSGGRGYKIFKTKSHPDLAGFPELQIEAEHRIDVHQQKLPAFPTGLPSRVNGPQELVRDKSGRIVGYEMDFVEPAEVLYRYGEKPFREKGVPDELVVAVLADLHKTVEALHKAKVVIGDFNDLNVLVRGRDAVIIDADSMQYGRFLADMFTTKFVDPLNCDQAAHDLKLIRPHNPNSDWYAYLIMLMQSFLYVGPFGGVFMPKDKSRMVKHDLRALKRVTVFDPEVRYPRPARALKTLPDDMLDLFQRTFAKDERGMPPLSLIESLRFTTCTKCGASHARGMCPMCVGITPAMVKEIRTGNVKGEKVFETGGKILYAAVQRGDLHYLWHEDGYYREGGTLVAKVAREPNVRYRIRGPETILARGNQCFIFTDGAVPERLEVETCNQTPQVAANADHLFYIRAGSLYRRKLLLGSSSAEHIGDVLQNQTQFWIGDELGFGFYRAAELSNFFLFNSNNKGINDSIQLPPIRGQLIDATANFTRSRVWFMTTTQEAGKTINRCHLVDSKGAHLGSAEATQGDGSWLSSIRGKTATGEYLLAPTDNGVVRISQSAGMLGVNAEYPDTSRFVDEGTNLFVGKSGLYAVRSDVIWRLTIGAP